jgi:hypothetical protein
MIRRIAPFLILASCAEPRGPQALWTISDQTPVYAQTPFPTDALKSASGTIERFAGLETIAPIGTELLVEHLARLDGFGVRPLVEIFLDAAIEPALLPPKSSSSNDSIYVIDLERAAVVPYEWRFDAERKVIAGSPELGVVLREGAPHAAVVKRSILSRSPALDTIADVDREQLPARWRSTKDAFESLEDRGEVAAIAAFTPQHATRGLISARSKLDELPPPTVSFPDASLIFDSPEELDRLLGRAELREDGSERWGWSGSTGVAHAHVGVIASGEMVAHRFRRPDTGDDGPDDETFHFEPGSSTPSVEAAPERLPITFILPKDPPRSERGYPVAIVGHGLGGSRHWALAFAEPYTEAGFALIAIDMDGHGSRLSRGDSRNNTASIFSEFTGDPELDDGFSDTIGALTTLDLFEGFRNLSAVRDSVRQSVLDLSQVAILLRRGEIDLSALAGAYRGSAPKLDTAELAYLGESYGSVVGSIFAAVEPEIDLFILDVPGGGVIDLAIPSSPVLRETVLFLAKSVWGLEGQFGRFHPLASLTQAIFDAGDPLSYAPHLLRDRLVVSGQTLRPRSILLIEAMHDELIPNATTEALARAAGIPLIDPTAGASLSNNHDGATCARVQYEPAAHGSNWTSEKGIFHYDPVPDENGDFRLLPEAIEIQNPIYETIAQVRAVLTSHLEGAPIVTVTKPPIADFDGDGMTDDHERAEGRDPLAPGR